MFKEKKTRLGTWGPKRPKKTHKDPKFSLSPGTIRFLVEKTSRTGTQVFTFLAQKLPWVSYISFGDLTNMLKVTCSKQLRDTPQHDHFVPPNIFVPYTKGIPRPPIFVDVKWVQSGICNTIRTPYLPILCAKLVKRVQMMIRY